MLKKVSLIASIVFAFIVFGCVSTQVTRVSSDTVTDLSGRWNDTDSRLVAEEMVRDSLSRPWVEDYVAMSGSKPVVIVGNIRNNSSEHIATEVFSKDIERELVNSGRVTFVASSAERTEMRSEREDQQLYATEESAKALAAETGADYMMIGVINSITDAADGIRTITYQVDMELIHLESTEKVWIGSKEIKKVIERGSANW